MTLSDVKCFLLDMDGTFYLGGQLIEGSLDFIDRVLATGRDYMFLTNNSSHNANFYVQKLAKMGLKVDRRRVMTSGEATCEKLKALYPGKRAFVLGFRQLGILLLMAITLIILVYVLQGVVMIPWALLIALKSLLFTSGETTTIIAILGNSLFNIFSVLLCYMTYVSIAVVLISGAYLYGSAVQQDEDVSIVSDIDNFENL